MQISITSGLVSRGRSGRSVSSSADSYSAGLELIDRPEIDIACNQHLDARPVAHPDGGRDIDGAAQNIVEHILRGSGVEDDRAASGGGLHLRLHDTVDSGDQHRSSESLPEMTI